MDQALHEKRDGRAAQSLSARVWLESALNRYKKAGNLTRAARTIILAGQIGGPAAVGIPADQAQLSLSQCAGDRSTAVAMYSPTCQSIRGKCLSTLALASTLDNLAEAPGARAVSLLYTSGEATPTTW